MCPQHCVPALIEDRSVMKVASRLAATMVALAIAAPLAGCSESQSDAEAAYCSALADVTTAVAGVKALTPQSTVNDAEAARDDLKSAVEELKKSAEDVKDADSAAVESAAEQIEKSVDSVSGKDTIAEAASAVKTSTADLEAALTEMKNGIQCT